MYSLALAESASQFEDLHNEKSNQSTAHSRKKSLSLRNEESNATTTHSREKSLPSLYNEKSNKTTAAAAEKSFPFLHHEKSNETTAYLQEKSLMALHNEKLNATQGEPSLAESVNWRKLEADEPKTSEKQRRFNLIIPQFEAERANERTFVEHLTRAIEARTGLMEETRNVLETASEFANLGAGFIQKYRLSSSTLAEPCIAFKMAAQQMAKDLYVLEHFRQAEADRLRIRILDDYTSGMDARNAKNRAQLKSLLKEARACFFRERKVRTRHEQILKRLSSGKTSAMGRVEEVLSCRSKNTGRARLSTYTWLELTQRAKLNEAESLRIKAEDAFLACYQKISSITQQAMKEVFRRYIFIEILFHTKAIEQLTKAYQRITENQDCKQDENLNSKTNQTLDNGDHVDNVREVESAHRRHSAPDNIYETFVDNKDVSIGSSFLARDRLHQEEEEEVRSAASDHSMTSDTYSLFEPPHSSTRRHSDDPEHALISRRKYSS